MRKLSKIARVRMWFETRGLALFLQDQRLLRAIAREIDDQTTPEMVIRSLPGLSLDARRLLYPVEGGSN